MINIHDIFKNKLSVNNVINNNLPFIILNCNATNLDDNSLIVKIPGPPNDNIFKLNYQKIYNALKINGINPTHFAPLGDIWFNKIPVTINILLVNIKISIKPIDYVKIDNYYNYTIWKPIGPIGYSAIGYIASQHKPSVNMIRLLPNAFLKEFNNNNIVEGRNINMNEYDLLSTINEKYYTIDKLIFIKSDNINTNTINDDNKEIINIWVKQTEGDITLLEDEDPWHVDKKNEHDKLLEENQLTTVDTDNTEIDGELENEKINCLNFNFIACSLLFLISLMISLRYFWK